jgi:hypothetical protein
VLDLSAHNFREQDRRNALLGTDIHGYIEVKLDYDGTLEEHWQAAINLFWLYEGSDYDAFGCFFGVRNYANFRPIALLIASL